jgi:hypothetical protein
MPAEPYPAVTPSLSEWRWPSPTEPYSTTSIGTYPTLG